MNYKTIATFEGIGMVFEGESVVEWAREAKHYRDESGETPMEAAQRFSTTIKGVLKLIRCDVPFVYVQNLKGKWHQYHQSK
jgi:hypothetical protein